MIREHKVVSEKVGLIDLTPFAKFIVKGADSRAFLDHTVAGFVPNAGKTNVVHALTKQAKVYAEFTVTGLPNQEEQFMIVTGSAVEGHDLRHLEQAINSINYIIYYKYS